MSRGDQPWEWSGRLTGAYWAMLVGQNKNCPKVLPQHQEPQLFFISRETLSVAKLARDYRRSESEWEARQFFCTNRSEGTSAHLKFQGRH